jgi:hypothetical protein
LCKHINLIQPLEKDKSKSDHILKTGKICKSCVTVHIFLSQKMKLAQFFKFYFIKIAAMMNACSNEATKKLVVRYILNDIDYKKRCLYLQEIIAMGRKDDLWIRALSAFFDSPMSQPSLKSISKN